MGRDTNGDRKRAGPQYGGAALGLRDPTRRLNVFPVKSSISLCVCSVSAWMAR